MKEKKWVDALEIVISIALLTILITDLTGVFFRELKEYSWGVFKVVGIMIIILIILQPIIYISKFYSNRKRVREISVKLKNRIQFDNILYIIVIVVIFINSSWIPMGVEKKLNFYIAICLSISAITRWLKISGMNNEGVLTNGILYSWEDIESYRLEGDMLRFKSKMGKLKFKVIDMENTEKIIRNNYKKDVTENEEGME